MMIITTAKVLSQNFPELKINSSVSSSQVIVATLTKDVAMICETKTINLIISDTPLDSSIPSITGNTPCYLLYTSGSTGNPKGILHTHKSACAFIEWASSHLNLTDRDVIAHKSNVCFDLSVFDIFATVKVAAKMVPVPDNYFNNGSFILDYINKKKITILYSVPSTVLNHLTENNLQRVKTSSLRHIIFAGEQLFTRHLSSLYKNLPQPCQIHNWYGPTETNVCSYFTVTEKSILENQAIPIGAACKFAELNHDKNNVLLIKSTGIMQSYWNQSRLPDIWYYSGDLVSQDEMGRYYYDGRIDRQVKFHGYRIQLEEIETVVNSFPGVVESAVIMDEAITAFVSTNSDYRNDSELLTFCRQSLESHMLPSSIYHIPEIPRTSREKIDYDRLLQLRLKSHAS